MFPLQPNRGLSGTRPRDVLVIGLSSSGTLRQVARKRRVYLGFLTGHFEFERLCRDAAVIGNVNILVIIAIGRHNAR
jgi:hypothetical protein